MPGSHYLAVATPAREILDSTAFASSADIGPIPQVLAVLDLYGV
jgi:hypothetical protein